MKEDFSRQNSEQKSPIKRTFYEAKQQLQEYESGAPVMDHGARYGNSMAQQDYAGDVRLTYMEADEAQYEEKSAGVSTMLNVRGCPTQMQIRSTESFLNDSSPEYFHPEEYIRAVKKDRTRRRRSKEMIETELIVSSNDDEPKRKPETMRSISEDSGNKPAVKPVTRRSLSHPEREKEVRTRRKVRWTHNLLIALSIRRSCAARRARRRRRPNRSPTSSRSSARRSCPSCRRRAARPTNPSTFPMEVPRPGLAQRRRNTRHPRVSRNKWFAHVCMALMINLLSPVPRMLQKKDSKSLEAVMRSVALTERLKNALQDNKSQSMDEGIFNEKDEQHLNKTRATDSMADLQRTTENGEVG